MAESIGAIEWNKWSFRLGNDWTDWRAFSPQTISQAPLDPGAYVLGLPKGPPLQRLLGADPHRLLDIGEAKSLRRRLESLWACASTVGATGHMAGWRLGSMGLLARLGCTVNDLRISWCASATKMHAYAEEGFLLRGYFDLFGELPPLNYKFNWSELLDE